MMTCGKLLTKQLFGTALKIGRPSSTIARRFSTTKSSADSLQQSETMKAQSEPLVENLSMKAEEQTQISEENAYKNKIIQEVIKEPILEETTPAVEIKAPADAPEKDKAFVQKQTTLWQKIKVVMVHLKHSFIDVWRDTKYLNKMVVKNGVKEKNYTLFEMRERRRITKDLIKFFPYAVLIILPGGELIFPFYMILLPNSTPTQFMTAANLGDRTKHLTEKQAEGYSNFLRSLPKFTKLLGIDPIKLYESLNFLEKAEGKEKDRQFYKAHDFEEKIQKFLKLKNKNDLMAPVSLSTLDSYELEQLNKIFYQLYVPGYTWINILYGTIFKVPFHLIKFIAKLLKVENPNRFLNNIFMKISFTIDNGPLSYLKKYLLLWQLKYHIKQIRKQDRVLKQDFSQLAKNPILHKAEFAKQRGIKIDDHEEILKFTEYYWLPLSLREDVSDDLLVWITVLRFKYADILV